MIDRLAPVSEDLESGWIEQSQSSMSDISSVSTRRPIRPHTTPSLMRKPASRAPTPTLTKPKISSYQSSREQFFPPLSQTSFVLDDEDTNSEILYDGLKQHPTTTDNKPAKTAWESFQNHINNIACDAMHFQMKPTSTKGSNILVDIIQDMQDEIETQKKKVKSFRRPSTNQSFALKSSEQFSDIIDEDLECEEDSNDDIPDEKDSVERPIQTRRESIISTSEMLMNIPRISEMERSRQVLYDRYLFHPKPWYDGLTTYERYKHVVEENRKKLKSEKQRPFSCPSIRRVKSSLKLPKRVPRQRPKSTTGKCTGKLS